MNYYSISQILKQKQKQDNQWITVLLPYQHS
jgi:hypothetical protein